MLSILVMFFYTQEVWILFRKFFIHIIFTASIIIFGLFLIPPVENIQLVQREVHAERFLVLMVTRFVYLHVSCTDCPIPSSTASMLLFLCWICSKFYARKHIYSTAPHCGLHHRSHPITIRYTNSGPIFSEIPQHLFQDYMFFFLSYILYSRVSIFIPPMLVIYFSGIRFLFTKKFYKVYTSVHAYPHVYRGSIFIASIVNPRICFTKFLKYCTIPISVMFFIPSNKQVFDLFFRKHVFHFVCRPYPIIYFYPYAFYCPFFSDFFGYAVYYHLYMPYTGEEPGPFPICAVFLGVYACLW
ncbi:pA238L [African swine fever virus]|uniref:PA238L n=1 Tax=African swine fever virus TaxID=10497 RepID=A0A8A1V7C9_ASF|nr:pA238L [African swine fever virus]